MASITEVIDYLMHLMQDDNAQREFDRDPDAALADRGLANVTGQDVRDARLMMADSGAVAPRHERSGHSGSGSDPVREIHHTTSNFTVGDVTTTVISVQDNDTLIVDSFNTDVTAIQDNDTTDVDVISIVDNDDDEEEAGRGEDEAEGPEGNDDEPGAGLAGELLGEGGPAGETPEGAGPAGDLPNGTGLGAEPGIPGTEPGVSGGEPFPGGGADPGAVVGAAPGDGDMPDGAGGDEPFGGDELASVDGFEVGSESDALDSGAGEGFAPGEDSGFGVQPELGTEAGLTPADESFDDELAG